MKNLTNISLAVLTIALTIQITQAQNYKAPTIDVSGKIYNKGGTHIGSVTKDGIISDAMGMKIGHVDSNGMLVDETTGEKLGKSEKNGNFVPHFGKTPDQGWSISTPLNGTCLVKDSSGNIKAEVHENYKAFGACAVHCLERHTNHSNIMNDKKTESAVYACPMHPDVTSDKAGKCTKCGMALVKKEK